MLSICRGVSLNEVEIEICRLITSRSGKNCAYTGTKKAQKRHKKRHKKGTKKAQKRHKKGTKTAQKRHTSSGAVVILTDVSLGLLHNILLFCSYIRTILTVA